MNKSHRVLAIAALVAAFAVSGCSNMDVHFVSIFDGLHRGDDSGGASATPLKEIQASSAPRASAPQIPAEQPSKADDGTSVPSSGTKAPTSTPWRHMNTDGYTGTREEACVLMGLGPADGYLCRKYEKMLTAGQCEVRYLKNSSVLDRLVYTNRKTGKHEVQYHVPVDLKDPPTREVTLCKLQDGLYVGRVSEKGCKNYLVVKARLKPDVPKPVAKPKPVAPAPTAAPQPPQQTKAPAPKAEVGQFGTAPRSGVGECPHPEVREGYKALKLCVFYPDDVTAKLDWWGGKQARDLWPQIIENSRLHKGQQNGNVNLYGLAKSERAVYVTADGKEQAGTLPNDGTLAASVEFRGSVLIEFPEEAGTKDMVAKVDLKSCTTYPPADATSLYRTRPGELAGFYEEGRRGIFKSYRLYNVGCIDESK